MRTDTRKYFKIGLRSAAVAALYAATIHFSYAAEDQVARPDPSFTAVSKPELPGSVAFPPLTPAPAEKASSVSRPDTAKPVERTASRPTDRTETTPGVDPIKTAGIVPGVFGSAAIPMRNFPVAGRWRKVFTEIGNCDRGIDCGRRGASFAMLSLGIRDKKFLDKLETVNRVVNTMIGYRKDKEIYGGLDYWATPAETLARGIGDCEDFAILKMAALIKAGVPAQSMSLVVLQDRELKVFHAVLSVATQSGNFILDNLYNDVRRDDTLKSYVPLYSFSTDRAWIHGGRPGSEQVAALSGDFTTIAPGEGLQ